MNKTTQSVDFKVLSRIYGKGRGWVFTPKNFVDLGSKKAISSALARHQAKGPIRSLARGLSRKVQIGKQTIELKRTTPRNLAAEGRISGLVIHALRHLGKERVDDRSIIHLQKRLSPEDKVLLLKDATYAPAWVTAIMRKIANSN